MLTSSITCLTKSCVWPVPLESETAKVEMVLHDEYHHIAALASA